MDPKEDKQPTVYQKVRILSTSVLHELTNLGNPHMKSRLDNVNDFDKMSLNRKEPRAGTSHTFYNRTSAPEKGKNSKIQ